MGMEYLGMGDVNVAEKHFKLVLEVDKVHVATYYQLGILFKQNKDNRQPHEKDSFIERLSTSYLRDQLEVLDVGLFELSVLNSFELSKNLNKHTNLEKI